MNDVVATLPTMQDTITFTNALWLAAIPPTLGFVGIIVTLIVNSSMTRRQSREEAKRTRDQLHAEAERAQLDRDAQRSLERDRFLRQERVGVYRELIASAGAVLGDSTNPEPGNRTRDQWLESSAIRNSWASALASAQLVGADEVVAVGEEINTQVAERNRPDLSKLVKLADDGHQSVDEEEGDEARKQRFDAALTAIVSRGDENRQLQQRLVEACRQSLADTAPN